MKVTVIGYWGGFPKAGEATSGYLLQHDHFNLLVDCGSAVLSQLQKFINVEELDAVILSHYHHDHIADIGPLQFARLIKTMTGNKSLPTLPIYGHQENMQAFNQLTYKNYTNGVAYNPTKTLTVGPFQIDFLKTKHPVPCYAMRVTAGGKSIVYTADSAYLDEFIPFASQTDLFICECNLYSNMDGAKMGHMNSSDAGRIAKGADVKELILTHLPHFGNLQDLVDDASQIFSGNVRLASQGPILNE